MHRLHFGKLPINTWMKKAKKTKHVYISDAYTKVAELVHRGKSSLITPTTTFLDQQAFGRKFIGPNATIKG